jgi:hypothetical protein
MGHTELKGVSRELKLWRVARPDSTTVTESVAAVATTARSNVGDENAEGSSNETAQVSGLE